MEKKKIIIFGATGNTGSYLTDYAKKFFDKNEYEIIAVGRRETNFFESIDVKFYSVDISKKENFNVLPTDNVYAVMMLAGVLPAFMSGYNPYDYIYTNILGALNVLEYCRINKVDRIIYTQTIADLSGYFGKEKILHPDMPRKIKMTGDHALYAISKSTAVDMIEHYHQEYGIKNFIFRLPTIYQYTPDDGYNVDGVYKKLGYRILIDKAINGEPIEMWGNPDNEKDIVYVADFSQMLCKAVLANVETGFYNVGTGVGTSLRKQIEGIIDVFCGEKKSEIIECPDKPDSPVYIMDIENAKRDLGYEPKYDYISYLKELKKEMKLDRFKQLKKNLK